MYVIYYIRLIQDTFRRDWEEIMTLCICQGKKYNTILISELLSLQHCKNIILYMNPLLLVGFHYLLCGDKIMIFVVTEV